MRYLKTYKIFESSQYAAFSELLDKCVVELWMNRSNDGLIFITADGMYFMYYTSGECQNDVWVEHLNGIDCLINTTIFDVKSKGTDQIDTEGPYASTRGSDDAEEALLWTIYTSTGNFDIEVRNSHNGYYCGEVALQESGGLEKLDMFRIKREWKKITEDF